MVTLALLSSGAALTVVTLLLAGSSLPRRRSHAGQETPTSAGLLFLPIILFALLWILLRGAGGTGAWFLFYAVMAGAVGFVDDIRGGAEERGFSGHLGALVRGRVTTGALKIAVFGGGALLYAVAALDGFISVLCGAVLMAGSTNLGNLFDVRPGRAIKFVGLLFVLALPFASPSAVLPVLPLVGGFLGLFAFDVRGRIMLGDAGAAVLGATLGHAVVAGGPGSAWPLFLAVILGLTALAEVSSISRVIERVRFLRRFDSWGRG